MKESRVDWVFMPAEGEGKVEILTHCVVKLLWYIYFADSREIMCCCMVKL